MKNSHAFTYASVLSDIAKESNASARERSLRGLAKLLVSRNHAHLIPAIQKSYHAVAKHHGKVAKVSMQSAMPLSTQDAQELETLTEKTFDAALDFDLTVNPSLIGGLRIIVDDRLIDLSYSTQLQQLHSRLTHT